MPYELLVVNKKLSSKQKRLNSLIFLLYNNKKTR